MRTPKTAASLCLATLLVGAGFARGEVVMLASGSLIEGTVQELAEVVIVRQGDDSLRLRASEVVHVGESKLAVYEYLRGRSPGDDTKIERHLRLANWAMVNQLLPQAALELLEARQANPRDRRLAVLERRLDELTRLAAQPVAPVVQPTDPVVDLAEPHRAPTDAAALGAEAIDSEEPLPRLPTDGLGYFTREIQPLLVNGCTKCHRCEAGDKFPLDPSWRHGHGTAKTTEHNLRTALAALDIGSPAASPLLVAARGPHVGVTPLAGSRHEELIQRLADWAESIGRLNVVSLPPAPSHLMAQREQFAAVPVEVSTPNAPATTFDPNLELASYEDVGPQEMLAPYGDRAPKPIQRGVQLKRVEPRDEFDPAIFNERFRRPEDDLPLNERSASR